MDSSQRFRNWFVSIVQAMLPVGMPVMFGLLFAIAAVDIALGIGVLTGRRWALAGMIVRSQLGVIADYFNLLAGNCIGAIVGLAVNVGIVWVVLLPTSRHWLRPIGQASAQTQ